MKKQFMFLFFVLAACQKRNSFSYREWQTGQASTSESVLKDVQTEDVGITTKYKNKEIKFQHQTINGLPVYNSFVKKVSSELVGVEIIQAFVTDEKYLKVAPNRVNSDLDLIARLKQIQPLFSKIDVLGIESVYMIEGKSAQIFRLISFFDKVGNPYQAFFKNNGEFVRAVRVGSHFADINVNVFTDGPLLSVLSDQVIKRVVVNPTLSNDLVYVTSEADKKIETIAPQLKFDLKDERFDQIQAFYSINKAFQWMKDQLQVSIPQRVDVVVHMGYPEKTNSAFYYQNKIRFGKGDDAVYSNIVSDPSIVYHETFHALIDSLAHLPFEGEGGSMNEGFADFFACLMLDRPYLGEASYLKGAYKRNLSQSTKLDEKNGGLYHDSSIVSSLLWELKEKLVFEKSKNLAVETLIRLNPASQFTDFNKKILEAAQVVLNADERNVLQFSLKAHGFANE